MQYFIVKTQERTRSRDVLHAGDLDAFRCHEIPEIWSILASITPEPKYSSLIHISYLSYFEVEFMRLTNLRLHCVIMSSTMRYADQTAMKTTYGLCIGFYVGDMLYSLSLQEIVIC